MTKSFLHEHILEQPGSRGGIEIGLRFYRRFIKSSSIEPDKSARETVLNYLLVSIFILSVVALADTAAVFIVTRQAYLLSRILSNVLTVAFIALLYRLGRRTKYQRAVAFVLLLVITFFGGFIAYQWSVWDPNGLLLLSLAVVMAGILISARFSLYLTCAIAVLLIWLQHAEAHGVVHPDLSWLNTKPTLGDVVGFAAMLFIIAFVSWLFNRQMEQSLRRARRSEQALQRQKALLEVKVQERTAQLQASQLEQMQELYRFAELGRLSTALFHDLANHLTTVSVDIEGLKHGQQPAIMKRIGDNIRHVDDVVQRVRQQIQGKTTAEAFTVLTEIKEIIKLSSFSAARAGVTITLEPGSVRPSLSYKGDVMRFRQIFLNTISNGIEAYPDEHQPSRKRQVIIRLERVKTTLIIHVTDYGMGVDPVNVAKIFEPFYSTKAKGVGIGLFIVKQVVEQDFQGTFNLAGSDETGTTFTVQLPGSYYAKNSGD